MASEPSPQMVQAGVMSERRREGASQLDMLERVRSLLGSDQKLFESVLEYISDGVMLFDGDGNVTFQNPAAERIWVGTAGSSEGRNWGKYRAFHADGRPYEPGELFFMRCLRSAEVVRREQFRIQRFDGSYGTLVASALPLFDRESKLCGALAVFSDITRVSEFENAAAMRAERMRRIQALTTDLAAALTSDQIAERIVDHASLALGAHNCGLWVSEGPRFAVLLRHIGYTEETLSLYGRIPLDGEAPLADAMRRCEPLFIESPDDYALRYPHSEARTRHLVEVPEIAFACLPLVVGKQAIGGLAFAFEGPRSFDADERAFLCLLADNCAQGLHRARTYEAEQRARTHMAVLFGLVDAVNAATSLEDVYAPALHSVERALGVERAAILLYDPDGVMRFKASHGLSQNYRDAVEGHSPWTRDVRNPRPLIISDTEVDDSVTGYREVFRAEGIRALAFVPLYHQKLLGKFMIYSPEPRAFSEDAMALVESIASQVAQAVARKLAEAEVARLFAEAEQARAAAVAASRMKDEFLAVVSHELRTPLTAISGWAAVLKGERRNDAQTLAKGIDVIDRNARVQTKIIEDILDVSRIVTGKLRLEPRPVSLANVVSEALDSVRTSAQAKDIELCFEFPDDPHGVIGDSARLRQIVWNLLSNAIKFTPQGGRVDVSLRRDSGMTELEVRDTGKGIEPEFLPYVFERFRQADSSTTRMQGGLGLGLAIVRHLVELHGGQVRAHSTGTGKGACFKVGFPVRAVFVPSDREAEDEEKVLSNAEQGLHAGVDLSDVRVLLVDDEPDARDLLKEVLSTFGARVVAAASVEAAMGVLSEFRPDVIVSDIGMPDQDGYALIRRIRELPEPLSRVPTIALTAYARHDDARKVLNAGFQGYLPKPTEPMTLATAVATAYRVGVRERNKRG